MGLSARLSEAHYELFIVGMILLFTIVIRKNITQFTRFFKIVIGANFVSDFGACKKVLGLVWFDCQR